jgi:hypothetical protein
MATFKANDKVTVIMNSQCHGKVLESNEKTTNVKLDHFPSPVVFDTEELRLRKTQ